MIAPADIISLARTAIGTPFRHQGRVVGQALDCAGLVWYVATSLALPVIDREGYGRRPRNGELEAGLDAQPCLKRIAADQIEPGDVLLIKFLGDPQHLAILAEGTMIHAWSMAGFVVEHDFTESWQRAVVRAYRFVEVAQ